MMQASVSAAFSATRRFRLSSATLRAGTSSGLSSLPNPVAPLLRDESPRFAAARQSRFSGASSGFRPSMETSSSSSTAAGWAASAAVSALVVLSATSLAPTPSLMEGPSDAPVSDEDLRRDWDEFMIKSIVPGEDEDDDDDDDDDDEEDEEEEGEEDDESGDGENGRGGPADEEEDHPPGDGGVMVLDEDQRDRIDPHDEQPPSAADDDDASAAASAASSTAAAPQGPADTDEDSGQGYEEGGGGVVSAAEEAAAEGVEDDPYANLPDEDEPTNCTICLINRRGPCRPHWRKFERCMKDHGDAKDGDSPVSGASSSLAEKCDKYMLPWLTCIQSRRNTYTLITNRFYQDEYVDKLEGNITDEQRGEGESFLVGERLDAGNGSLDLSLWVEYVRDSLASAAEEGGVSDEEVQREMEEARAFLDGKKKEKEEGGGSPLDSVDDSVNLAAAATSRESTEPSVAEEAAEDVEPELVTATATVLLRDPSPPTSSDSAGAIARGHPIDLAYARDQDGNLLGFEQFSDAKKAMRGESSSSSGSEGAEKEAKGGSEKAKEGEAAIPTTAKLTFHIQPGKTQSFRIYTIYREDRPDDEEDEEKEDGSDRERGRDEKKQDGKDGDAPARPPAEERLYSSRVMSLFSDHVLADVKRDAEDQAADGGSGED